MANDKPIIWMRSSKKDLKALDDNVQDAIGHSLDRVQKGLPHPTIKALKGKEFTGVQEIRANVDSSTYRAVYALNLGNWVFMLHVFQKKSKKGSATPKADLDVIRQRLREAKELAKELEDENKKWH